MSMPPNQSTPSTSTPFSNAPQPQRQPNMLQSDFSPFSTALPMESQMFLGSALDPDDPLTSMLMAGSENMPQYTPNPISNNSSSSNKSSNFHPSFDGLSSTLAPSALDKYPSDLGLQSGDSSLSFDVFYADTNSNDQKPGGAIQGNSTYRSGTVTPGLDNDWSAFIDDASWEQGTA
jgi:hypothetical protein